jgi:tetratricopeptide (TPR) repeat protein
MGNMKTAKICLIIAALLFCNEALAKETYYDKNWCYEYFQLKEYDKAIAECTSQIDRVENKRKLSIIYTLRGLAYKNSGIYDKAEEDYTRAIDADHMNFRAFANRGIVYALSKRFDEAEIDLKRALEINPSSELVMYNLAGFYSTQMKSEKACVWLKRAIESGYSNIEHMEEDDWLDNIRDAACYKEIMTRLSSGAPLN